MFKAGECVASSPLGFVSRRRLNSPGEVQLLENKLGWLYYLRQCHQCSLLVLYSSMHNLVLISIMSPFLIHAFVPSSLCSAHSWRFHLQILRLHGLVGLKMFLVKSLLAILVHNSIIVSIKLRISPDVHDQVLVSLVK